MTTTTKSKRAYGTGSTRQRGPRSFQIKYYDDGQVKTETVRTDKRAVAEKELRARIVDIERGGLSFTDVKALMYEDLRDAYLKAKPEQAGAVKAKLGHIDKFFGGRRAVRITADFIRDYIAHREDEDGVAGPTIRRELTILRAMFFKAQEDKKLALHDVPHFDMPEDSEAAGKYISPAEFSKILDGLTPDLRPFYTLLYGTACRLGAARAITWDMVSKDGSQINLPAAIVKNKTALTLHLVGPLLAPLADALKKSFRRAGLAVFDSTNFRPEWNKACAKAGLRGYDEKTRMREAKAGYRIHDCRCSGAINAIDAGVPADTVLKIGGWKTMKMLSHYLVLTDDRVREAMEKAGAHYMQKSTQHGA